MRNRKIRVKPSRPHSILGGVVGVIFVFIGIFMAIPSFGPFGILWTLIALAMTIFNFYTAFSKEGVATSEIFIENDNSQLINDKSIDVEARLAQLTDLYDRRVITKEEYEAQRSQIIGDI